MSGAAKLIWTLGLGIFALAFFSACEPTDIPFQAPADPRNVCGGWEPTTFRHRPGDACGMCGAGRFVCQGDSALVCAGDQTNACGGCAELTAEVGDNCGACGGAWACSDSRDGLVCLGADQNVCGGCDQLEADPGDSCGECGDGKFLCGPDGQLFCDERPRNECGGCGELRGSPGTSCGVCGAGSWECAADANHLKCSEPDESTTNLCGGCLDLVMEPGTSCGACGVWACQGANGLTCQENGLIQCGYIDEDGDGWGTAASACACDGVAVAPRTGDCDDADPNEHPSCGDRRMDCGDDIACEFVAEESAGMVVRPLLGMEPSPGTLNPMSASSDVTGDGIDDLVVALPHALCTDETPGCGATLVLAGPLTETKLSQPALERIPSGTTFGDCVSVGDFDEDGVGDVAVVGTDGEEVRTHFFMGPLPNLRYLQPSTADYVVDALLRTDSDSRLLSCDAVEDTLVLSFDSTPHVQVMNHQGLVDRVHWGTTAARRVVADVVDDVELGEPVAYVLAYYSEHVDVELWSGFAPYQTPHLHEVRRILDRHSSATIRVRAVPMGEGIGLMISSPEIGIGIYGPREGDWPLFPDVTILGLRVLPIDGWPIAGGVDLDGDGALEFVLGNSDAPGTGQLVWGSFEDYLGAGWGTTIYPSETTVIEGGIDNYAFGTWVAARGDLNNDGEPDLVALEAGGQEIAPEAVIFFARRGN